MNTPRNEKQVNVVEQWKRGQKPGMEEKKWPRGRKPGMWERGLEPGQKEPGSPYFRDSHPRTFK